ncbi:MAG TPA: hypothetical protein VFI27_06810 [candidate division Zixibacteria bacterium]|nr:hypothetical protein [candidate division Zixibacteria bacterium]
MKRYHIFVFVLITGALLTACNSSLAGPEIVSGPQPAVIVEASPAAQEPVSAPVKVIQFDEIDVEQVEESSADRTRALWPDGEVRIDEQGFVEVAVTPLNLNAPDGTLNFNVGLETHSVDLSMDLATLATLEADNGLGVQAIWWDAPSGGHHISGVLSFPADSDGATLLEGASNVTLKIRDVDASERAFTWSLAG